MQRSNEDALFFCFIATIIIFLSASPLILVFIFTYITENSNSGVFIDIGNDLHRIGSNNVFSIYAEGIDYSCITSILKELKVEEGSLSLTASQSFSYFALEQCMDIRNEDMTKFLIKKSSSLELTAQNVKCLKQAFMSNFNLDYLDPRECSEMFKKAEVNAIRFEHQLRAIQSTTCGILDVEDFKKLFFIEIILNMKEGIPRKLWTQGLNAYKDSATSIFDEIFSCSIKKIFNQWNDERNFVSIKILRVET